MTEESKLMGQPLSRRAMLNAGLASATAATLLGNPTLRAMAAGETGAKAPAPVAPQSSSAAAGADITYRSGDTDIKAYLVHPDNAKPKAAIIVVHEIWGLTDHIRDVARRFARQGYLVLAPDLFTREGMPKIDPANMNSLMAFLAAIPDRRMVADLEAGLAFLRGQGAEHIGSVGFCMGGLYSYLLATKSTQLDAAVDFYGRIVYTEINENKPESPLDLAPQLKCPLLCNFGETDTSITQPQVQQLREKLKPGTQPWKINVYPGAGHAFFNDTRPSYNKDAATEAWTEMLAFFKKHLQPPSAS